MEPTQTVQEFSIKLRKNTEVTRNIMRFSAGLNVEFHKWEKAIMERENNNKNVTKLEKKMPMYGAGPEFGRTAKEEANKDNSEDEPLILSTSEYDKDAVKNFKGTKLGGITENSSYYMISQSMDGSLEAFPLHEWYNFQRYTVQRNVIHNNEEAEKTDNQKNSAFNSFNGIKHTEDDKDDKDKNNTKETVDKKKDQKQIKKESSNVEKIRSDPPSGLEYNNKHKIIKKIFCRKSNLDIPIKATDNSANTLKRKRSSSDESLEVKKPKIEDDYESAVTEESVSRYLKRKPMSLRKLIKKFQSKETGLTDDELTKTLTTVLQNMNLRTQRINGKTCLSVY